MAFQSHTRNEASAPQRKSGRKRKVVGIPTLTISRRASRARSFDPERVNSLRYRHKTHAELPHVLKFSGGRSSGMLLFTLLENKILKASRGDVVVFNNTGAEHPATYDFIKKCKEITEEIYGIPFFLTEYQTYEDVGNNGEWTRFDSYRLVNADPISSNNPNGYKFSGEPFEEMMSWSGYVPNQFQRNCTAKLKVRTTKAFLQDWLTGKNSIPHLGHWKENSRVVPMELYRRHLRSRGKVPENIFLKKKEYVLSCPASRPEQRYADFSSAAKDLAATAPTNGFYTDNIFLRENEPEYVSFIGLRGDEPDRVLRVQKRASKDTSAQGYEGENVYMPLADMNVSKQDVIDFWNKNEVLDLKLPNSGNLSNCVYCFLKGKSSLAEVYQTLETDGSHAISDFQNDTPADIAWWSRIERKYARDMDAEDRGRSGYVGFFGVDEGLTYGKIEEEGLQAIEAANMNLPCDCTD